MTAIRKRLVPKNLRDRIKDFWTMKERPVLSESNVAKLTTQFDKDLAQLGQWLGIELTCANFKEVAKRHAPDWKNPPTSSDRP